MFDFKDKTIDEFRKEVADGIGKKVTLQCGNSDWVIDAVTENGEHYISSLTGVFDFQPNGEFDWNKGVKGVKMYGFIVTIALRSENGRIIMNTERIIVPFETKDEKQYVKIYNDSSILKK